MNEWLEKDKVNKSDRDKINKKRPTMEYDVFGFEV